MPAARRELTWQFVEAHIEAFEKARALGRPAGLREYLPAADDPQYLPVLRELVRVDLEFGWREGGRPGLADYQDQFPELFRDGRSLAETAFEEFRLRRQAGEEPQVEDYCRQYGFSSADWPIDCGPIDGSHPGHRRTEVAYRLLPDDSSFPPLGGRFAGFELIGELGRGAFARVYLARQADLSGRLVAHKITSEEFGDADTLARLQHSHIVPVYSVHREGGLTAECMPYFGGTTLADVLSSMDGAGRLPASGRDLVETVCRRLSATRPRQSPPEDLGTSFIHSSSNPDGATFLDSGTERGVPPPTAPPPDAVPVAPSAALNRLESMTWVEAVLWIGARLADGLAHAHERGILHRDIKPANVLLADDGLPMLLDFNLALDRSGSSQYGEGRIVGTLAYMAPEQLDAIFHGGPAGSVSADLYSLALILYELLTGRRPFPVRSGPWPAAARQTQEDRPYLPDAPSVFNRAVPRSVDAIIQKLLAPDPNARYSRAEDLQFDLQRPLNHLPLVHVREPSFLERAAKWCRRHPRLSSSSTIGVAATLLLLLLSAGMWTTWRRLEQSNAHELFDQGVAESHELQFMFHHPEGDLRQGAEALVRAKRLFGLYALGGNQGWEPGPSLTLLPDEEQHQLRPVLGGLLLSSARYVGIRALDESDPVRRASQLQEALALNEKMEVWYPAGRLPMAAVQQRNWLTAALHRSAATPVDPAGYESVPPASSPNDHFLLAAELYSSGEFQRAAALLERAVRSNAGDVDLWYLLANCQLGQARYDDAAGSYTATVAL
jgi:serine/threonine protein kinase